MVKFIYFLGIVFLLLHCKGDDIVHSDKEGQVIPSFNIMLLDSTTFVNSHSVFNSDPVVFLFFDPYCEYCQEEIESIIGNIKKFENIQFWFISIASLKSVSNFYERYNLKNYSSIHVGIDTAAAYLKYFSISSVPHTSVYTKDKILKRVFVSTVDTDQLLDMAK